MVVALGCWHDCEARVDAGSPADALLESNPFGLLVGMLLDQQVGTRLRPGRGRCCGGYGRNFAGRDSGRPRIVMDVF